jgi:Domain of unknown function (DUF4337)
MASEPAPAEPAEKKSLFETIVVSTPVILAVIATFLLGRSSSEMTLAQYYRSVASQNQSKVGDQWGFFQAKRIRGQILEGNAAVLLAQKRSPFGKDALTDAAEQMVKELQAAEKASGIGDLKALVAEANEALAATKRVAESADAKAALEALQLKPAKKTKAPKESAPVDALAEIINDIKKRTPEKDMAKKALKISDEALRQAIEDAENKAAEIAKRGKTIDSMLEEFDALVEQQTSLGLRFQQIVRAGRSAKNPEADSPDKNVEAIRTLNANLQGDYQAARSAFDARRYEDDARSNQDLAYLYEVKVSQSSARSDQHLFRSQMFLFAMLVAQAGVTIATLALAVKRKSIFWLLATIAGLASIAFGVYVYLDMPAIPGM